MKTCFMDNAIHGYSQQVQKVTECPEWQNDKSDLKDVVPKPNYHNY